MEANKVVLSPLEKYKHVQYQPRLCLFELTDRVQSAGGGAGLIDTLLLKRWNRDVIHEVWRNRSGRNRRVSDPWGLHAASATAVTADDIGIVDTWLLLNF